MWYLVPVSFVEIQTTSGRAVDDGQVCHNAVYLRTDHKAMIDAKQAADSAREYFTMFFPEAKNVQLEEVELDSEGTQWLVTLSFPEEEGTAIGLYPKNRKYKLFRIDAKKGNVVAMKARER